MAGISVSRYIRRAGAIVAVSITMALAAGVAGAEAADRFHFKVCNTKPFTVMVAVRYNSDGTNYITHGWWQVEAHTCQEIADFRSGEFFVFAQSFNMNPVQVFVAGPDQAKYCVSITGRFSYSGSKTCAASDYRDFSRLSVSDPTVTWTL